MEHATIPAVITAVNNIFNAVDAIPFVKLMPKLQSWSRMGRAAALNEAAEIADKLPASFNAVQVTDATFSVLENVLSDDKPLLEWLRTAVDALFAAPPAVT